MLVRQSSANFRKDVARLYGWIEPLEGEPPVVEPLRYAASEGQSRTLQNAIDALQSCRRGIAGAEQHLAKMENYLNQVASQSVSREEMRSHLKDSR